jgi:hypothetical protein
MYKTATIWTITWPGVNFARRVAFHCCRFGRKVVVVVEVELELEGDLVVQLFDTGVRGENFRLISRSLENVCVDA